MLLTITSSVRMAAPVAGELFNPPGRMIVQSLFKSQFILKQDYKSLIYSTYQVGVHLEVSLGIGLCNESSFQDSVNVWRDRFDAASTTNAVKQQDHL